MLGHVRQKISVPCPSKRTSTPSHLYLHPYTPSIKLDTAPLSLFSILLKTLRNLPQRPFLLLQSHKPITSLSIPLSCLSVQLIYARWDDMTVILRQHFFAWKNSIPTLSGMAEAAWVGGGNTVALHFYVGGIAQDRQERLIGLVGKAQVMRV